MRSMRECRLRQMLNKISISDETDTIPPRLLKEVKDVLDDLKQLDSENTQCSAIETIIDNQIYNTANNVTYKTVSVVDFQRGEYNQDDFIQRLKVLVTANNPDEYSHHSLMKLAKLFHLNNNLPTNISYNSLYAGSTATLQTQSSQATQKSQQRKRNVVKQAEKKKLVGVIDSDSTEEHKTNSMLKHYSAALNETYEESSQQPINYYAFILDKNSFSKTIENAFYTSFLVNNGSLRLFMDDLKNLLLEPNANSDFSQGSDQQSVCQELAMNLSYGQWKALCEAGD